MTDIQEISRALSALLERPDERRRQVLADAITQESIPGKIRLLGNQVIVVGVGIDRWTVDGAPAGVVFTNKDDQEMVWQLALGCQAVGDDLPVTARVDDGETTHEVVFAEPGVKRVTLPALAARGRRLLIITTDKTWTPGTHDQRNLGVSIDITPTGTFEDLLVQRDEQLRAKLTDEIAREAFPDKRRLLGNQIVAAGLSLDHWTIDGQPAGVVYTNYDEREVSPELIFGCHAGPADLPLTMRIEDGRRTREVTLEQPGFRRVTLPPVGPHAKRLYIIDTDRTWSPGGGDTRKLGISVNISPSWTLANLRRKPDAYIRVKLAEVVATESFPGKLELLGDLVVAVGLTGDRWTESDNPAALVVTNTFDDPVVPRVSLGCHAAPDELPITATVDDGQNLRDITFDEPGIKQVDFTPVPHHSRRLFMITTDKTWTPGNGDDRQLGVQLQVSAVPVLSALAAVPEQRIWNSLADAAATGRLPDTLMMGAGRAFAVGLSPDGWTGGGQPAAIAIDNTNDAEEVWQLTLACHAPAEQLPISATVSDGERQWGVRFDEPGQDVVVLSPVAADSRRLFVVDTEGAWTPGNGDDRSLGVLVHGAEVSLPGTLASLLRTPHDGTRRWALERAVEWEGDDRLELLDDRAVAVGLTGDQWTTDAGPAAVALRNEGDDELIVDVHLDCHAAPEALPITATVDDGETQHKVRFTEAGTRVVAVPPMPAGEQRLLIVTTDKTWTPGTEQDRRQLGVRVTLEV